MADIVYLVQDMMFTSKIREAAKTLGLSCQSVRDVATLPTAAAAAKIVIVDLRLPTAMGALQSLAADPASASIPSVGFVEHERLDVMEAARANGCSEVMAKGQFANSLGRLFASLAPSAS